MQLKYEWKGPDGLGFHYAPGLTGQLNVRCEGGGLLRWMRWYAYVAGERLAKSFASREEAQAYAQFADNFIEASKGSTSEIVGYRADTVIVDDPHAANEDAPTGPEVCDGCGGVGYQFGDVTDECGHCRGTGREPTP